MRIGVGLLVFLCLIVMCVTGRLSDRSILLRFMLYLDMFFCALVLNDPDLTISSRCGLALRGPRGPSLLRGLGRVLNALQKNHCTLAIEDDRARAQHALELLR